MANCVLIVDLGDAADSMQYEALTRLMRDFGFIPRGPKTQRPAQFSITSAFPLRGLKQVAEARIKAELQANVLRGRVRNKTAPTVQHHTATRL